jgi:hypothetical protein
VFYIVPMRDATSHAKRKTTRAPVSDRPELVELPVFAHIPWCYHCGKILGRIGNRYVCQCGTFETACAF